MWQRYGASRVRLAIHRREQKGQEKKGKKKGKKGQKRGDAGVPIDVPGLEISDEPGARQGFEPIRSSDGRLCSYAGP